jgi:hypothetical protein
MLGRVAMVILSAANVVFCSMMLGEAAGVQLLVLPCGMAGRHAVHLPGAVRDGSSSAGCWRDQPGRGGSVIA